MCSIVLGLLQDRNGLPIAYRLFPGNTADCLTMIPVLADLAAVSCANAGGNWWLFDHRTELTDGLFALIGRESPTKWMRTSDIKALLNKSIEPVVEIPREAS